MLGRIFRRKGWNAIAAGTVAEGLSFLAEGMSVTEAFRRYGIL